MTITIIFVATSAGSRQYLADTVASGSGTGSVRDSPVNGTDGNAEENNSSSIAGLLRTGGIKLMETISSVGAFVASTQMGVGGGSDTGGGIDPGNHLVI